tara:strand:- start:21 stop:485 length:465 start_codon:yes stop_codon:yes gene_type:complete
MPPKPEVVMIKRKLKKLKRQPAKATKKPDGMTFASANDKMNFQVLDFWRKKDYSKTLLSEVGTDYEKLPGFSSAKAKQFTKLESLYEDGLTGKQANQKERFDEMYFEGIRSLMEKRIKNAERAFKKENKGKKTLNEWEKLWDNFREDINLDDYK